MKLPALLTQLYCEPALITADGHASIRQVIASRLGLSFEDGSQPVAREPGTGACGEKVEVEQMEIKDGIAYIPINGAIGQKLSPFERGEGAVDVLDVANEIATAEADKEVRAIWFDFDSPGGMVSGTPELADKIRAMKKPKYAFTNSLVASAAYWLASATDAIFATPTASIGSIGVFLPVVDSTGFLKQRGIHVELIKAGRYKGMGFPGTPLSDEQRQHLQARIDGIYQMFTGAVTKNRPMASDPETFQGQTFLAAEAQSRGLIDFVVSDRAEALASI